MNDTIDVGTLVVKSPILVSVSFETAAWWLTVKVEPGEYPVRATVRDGWNLGQCWAALEGVVTAGDLTSRIGAHYGTNNPGIGTRRSCGLNLTTSPELRGRFSPPTDGQRRELPVEGDYREGDDVPWGAIEHHLTRTWSYDREVTDVEWRLDRDKVQPGQVYIAEGPHLTGGRRVWTFLCVKGWRDILARKKEQADKQAAHRRELGLQAGRRWAERHPDHLFSYDSRHHDQDAWVEGWLAGGGDPEVWRQKSRERGQRAERESWGRDHELTYWRRTSRWADPDSFEAGRQEVIEARDAGRRATYGGT